MKETFIFKEMALSGALVADIARMNPWWEGKPMVDLPKTRRHLVGLMDARLQRKLAPIIVVRGPRQIGKTTAQMQLIQILLKRGVDPTHIIRLQCDELPEIIALTEPILRVIDWYEQAVLKQSLNQAAHAGQPAFLFLDEVQNLREWAPQLKNLVDNATVHVVVTGSSALRIEQGRDSLAGRITTIESGVLSLTEIGAFGNDDLGNPFLKDNGLEPIVRRDFWIELAQHGLRLQKKKARAFTRFSERGGYPLAHKDYNVSWEHVADQLNETVIKRVIQHDLRVGDRGRKRDAALLEEVFRLACRYAGQAPNLNTLAREAHRALNANVGPQRINHYLKFLGDTLLLRLIEPLEIRLKKRRGAPKICLADHGLRASWLQEIIPLDPERLTQEPHLSTLAGHIAESVVGAILATITGLDIAYFPERRDEPEVDFVLTVGTRRVPVEVKYQRKIDELRDTEALRAFVEKTVNNASFGILITQTDQAAASDPRIVSLPLSTFMLLR